MNRPSEVKETPGGERARDVDERAGPGRIHHDVDGNRLTVLPDGPDRLKAVLDAIRGAERSLRVLFYIWDPDASGIRVRDALHEARERGVAVSLIVDGFGASSASAAFFGDLARAGAHVCRYHPRLGRRYLLRNHQKLLLADERIAITGGFNVADDYFGTVEDGAWRDLGLIIEGPAAERIADYYDRLEAWSGRPRSRMRDLRRIMTRASEDTGALRWVLGGPTRRLSPWARQVLRDVTAAHSLDLISAYFGPTPPMLRRIARVGRRGRARLVSAAKSDNGATVGAARQTFGLLLRRGVEVWEYTATKLHTKLIVVDDAVYIGSANFDVRSTYLNLEIGVRVEDAAFADKMRAFVERELKDCERITPALHKKRATLWARIRWAVSRFVVGVVDYNVTRRLNFGLNGR